LKDDEFLQLTDSPVDDLSGRINQHREIVWKHGDGLTTDIYMLRPQLGDIDQDGVLGLYDFAALLDRLTGPVAVDSSCFILRGHLDSDADGDFDLRDYASLQDDSASLDHLAEFVSCLTGPLRSHNRCTLRFFDFDGDNDVDLYDCAVFQRSTGQRR
jgi:hypothetical protein